MNNFFCRNLDHVLVWYGQLESGIGLRLQVEFESPKSQRHLQRCRTLALANDCKLSSGLKTCTGYPVADSVTIIPFLPLQDFSSCVHSTAAHVQMRMNTTLQGEVVVNIRTGAF